MNQNSQNSPQNEPITITSRETVFHTPWFYIEARGISCCETNPPHYVVCGHDYVCAIPITTDGNIILVRQYRPAIDDYVLELPSGTVEHSMNPDDAILHEIREETGWRATSLERLGILQPDVGRLDIRQHVYFCQVEPDKDRLFPDEGEIDLTSVSMPVNEYMEIAGERPDCIHALNLAALFMAIKHGKLSI